MSEFNLTIAGNPESKPVSSVEFMPWANLLHVRNAITDDLDEVPHQEGTSFSIVPPSPEKPLQLYLRELHDDNAETAEPRQFEINVRSVSYTPATNLIEFTGADGAAGSVSYDPATENFTVSGQQYAICQLTGYAEAS